MLQALFLPTTRKDTGSCVATVHDMSRDAGTIDLSGKPLQIRLFVQVF